MELWERAQREQRSPLRTPGTLAAFWQPFFFSGVSFASRDTFREECSESSANLVRNIDE